MIRVMVVDDDPMVRRLLETILGADGTVEVVATAADGDEVVPGIQAHHPDVVLMDLHMARVDGIAATRAVTRLPTPPAVLAMTSFSSEAAVIDAIQAGAAGFLAKDADPGEISRAVAAVAAGDGTLSPRAAKAVVARVAADPRAPERDHAQRQMAALTAREHELACAVAQGLSNAEIAATAYVSEATVKTHLNRAMTKVGATNRVQLALVVDRAGFGPATA
ncbi:response regulator transcription factor [Paraoerskovia marina]|uniref:response regulator transcription factor n=1 Tax=Paraoerskovia marina TaxID=545619 RepID=UPI000693622E|nr:response regulator transcription factor [Paraoerskovia marina]